MPKMRKKTNFFDQHIYAHRHGTPQYPRGDFSVVKKLPKIRLTLAMLAGKIDVAKFFIISNSQISPKKLLFNVDFCIFGSICTKVTLNGVL